MRWLQPDTVIPEPYNPQSWNRYSYVRNNPINLNDPTGHREVSGCSELAGGCNITQKTKDDDARKLALLEKDVAKRKCEAGNENYCPTIETHPGEVVGFAAVGLIGGAALESFILGGSGAAAAETAFWKAAQSCIGSAVCRWVTGMAGGAGADSGQGFSSFRALKKFLGDPGDGMEWHHIVEQNQITKSGFPVEQVQNTNNIIAVDETTHDLITAVYNSNVFGPGSGRVRDWLVGQSFEAQYEYGLQVLRNLGVIP